MPEDRYIALGYPPIHPAVQVALMVVGLLCLAALVVYGFSDVGAGIADAIAS